MSERIQLCGYFEYVRSFKRNRDWEGTPTRSLELIRREDVDSERHESTIYHVR
jgi:hypothetical protein